MVLFKNLFDNLLTEKDSMASGAIKMPSKVLFSKNFSLAPIRLALARCIGRALLYFGDTLENFGDTQMCRDTQFEKHWSNE